MNIAEKQSALVEEFAFFDEWMDKYAHIIELGKSLPLLPEEDKEDSLLVNGCQSRVWLKANAEDGKVYFQADSDAIIAKGIIAMLIDVFNGQPAEEIVASNVDFLDEIGLKAHLSPTRANGLVSMVKQLKFYALALQSK